MGQRSHHGSESASAVAGGFTALFEAERIPMVRMATLMLGSAAQAEEIVQEGFVAVEQRWDQLDRPGGYLRTTVVNGCRQALRRREVETRHSPDARVVLPPATPASLVELHDALHRLDDRQRSVIVLRYFVDIPDREIADILGCRPSTVRSIAHRALGTLREELT